MIVDPDFFESNNSATLDDVVYVQPGSEALGHNLHHTRKYLKSEYDYQKRNTNFYEKLSLIVYEGSALTFLGMIEYNPGLNKGKGGFHMTKLAGIIAGGVKESLKFFK